MPVLKLKDDIDTIDFINDSEYSMEDDTLEISMPQRNDIRYASVGSGGENLISASYNNRTISLSFFVHGATQAEINSRISKVSRMIVRNIEPVYIGGSGYSASNTPDVGSNTGESGLVFISRLHDETGPSKKNESNVTGNLDLSVVYKIITANLTVESRHTASNTMQGSLFAKCNLEMEAAAFGVGESYVVLEKGGTGFVARSLAPFTGSANHAMALIDKDDILGDVPALTRIYTELQTDPADVGRGIIVAREAGVSVLRCPGYPTFSGSAANANKVSIYGQILHGKLPHDSDANIFRVRIKTLSPDTLEYSTNDGGSYTGDISFTDGTAVNLGSTLVRVVVNGVGNLTVGDYWRFVPHQSNTPTDPFTANAAAEDALDIVSDTEHWRLKVSQASPLRVQYSTSDGSVYSGSITPSVGVPFSLGSTGIEVVFHSITGFTLNDYWRFVPHQVAAQDTSAATVIGTNSASNQNEVYSKDGINVATFNFTMPKGASGKYKLYAIMAAAGTFGNDISLEVQAGVKFFAHGMSTTADMTRTYFDWNRFITTNGTLDLGTVDVGMRSNSIGNHPASVSHMSVQVRVRSTETISGGSANVNVPLLYLVPFQDDNGFMHIAYGMDTINGHQVFSNFNPKSPYFGAVNDYFVNGAYIEGVSIAALDETHAGNPITLIPGVDNTLLFLPMSVSGSPVAVTPHWKRTIMLDGAVHSTNQTTVVIKPRYLYSE